MNPPGGIQVRRAHLLIELDKAEMGAAESAAKFHARARAARKTRLRDSRAGIGPLSHQYGPAKRITLTAGEVRVEELDDHRAGGDISRHAAVRAPITVRGHEAGSGGPWAIPGE